LTSAAIYNLLQYFIAKVISRFRAGTVKITVSTIPEEGLNLRFSKSRDWLEKAMPDTADPLECVEDIHVSCHVRKLAENVFLEGSIDTVLAVMCSRCLERALLPVSTLFRYTLVPLPDRQSPEIELSSEDLESGYYDEDVFDLEQLILEQIILQIPIKVLCEEDCRGLCPSCGINLNMETCRCRDKIVDDRFAVLKNIKIPKK
jgi:uncharacterized protein